MNIKTNPLNEGQLVALGQLVEELTRDQILWISGYLERRLAAAEINGNSNESVALSPTETTTKLTILYGTDTGRSKSLAEKLEGKAATRQIVANAISMYDYKTRQLKSERNLAVIVSTHGEGEPPELQKKLGYSLGEPKPFKIARNGDNYGWKKGTDDKWHLTYFVEGGRVKDNGEKKLKSALREIAQISDGDFILTGNQNVIIAGVSEKLKAKINAILKKYNVAPENISGLRKNSIACVALPACPLTFSEAERYLPALVSKLEDSLGKHGLLKEEIVIRMTGCPNGCGRPYLAEIGLIGRSPGYYNLYLGGSFNGSRLNRLYRETISEKEILDELDPIFRDYGETRKPGEKLDDFVLRKTLWKKCNTGKIFDISSLVFISVKK